MTFKNISLFSLLFLAGFAGMIVHADFIDRIMETGALIAAVHPDSKEYLQEMLEIHKEELSLFAREHEVLERCKEGWDALEDRMRSQCTEEHFENRADPCLDARFARLSKDKVSNRISFLLNVMNNVRTKVDDLEKKLLQED